MTQPAKILVIFGTRPEAIKLFPVIRALQADPRFTPMVCVSAQHRQMLDQVLDIAAIKPDYDLNLMQPGQTLDGLTAALLTELGKVMDAEQPARVIVQGDTATAMAGALAAYYRKIPVDHVEAGLRSGNIYHPWPEEVNRKIIGTIASLHFAPTQVAAGKLLAEQVPADRVHVTGNTVIDALKWVQTRIFAKPSLAGDLADLEHMFADRRIIGVTCHRRESFGDGMANIAEAIRRIAQRRDVAVIFPVHLNPNVRAVMGRALGQLSNVALIEPLDYPHFVRLLSIAEIMLTDSGGVQEEAPALGKPVLVMRETTERPEGVTAGTAKLVGTDVARIVTEIFTLLDDKAAYQAMARAHNPFGDGQSARRIVELIGNEVGQKLGHQA
ncbi:non-hydrolyzing UDP-N-acetylglucosamine 2-epimerase [Novosphingobium ginsenosidimutans]|uniref:UDP-N-acetylglucosamine 2-epimerase (non-hydrolyzing) n=1 Tax=Novosphingobium ginsenosidimutans TaxID=1176536 RepID=A0A5B8S4E0_9SPHN|nr:UDP-N-acetylglucosamine 2-epimerase (non-hydrolyzing) [Novosphingobium ginsenosidimutans]QEA16024.1 UDP-N-acetylglucosamine 2-epimerase (non-hydrolyzing) [Novosphingobium ginsenosidimutans]